MTDTPTEREGEGTWAKLRRRKVVQWGIAYAAGAWTLLQVLEYFGETYAWPRAVRQIAGLALPLGLLFVLVVAWYHGDKGEQKISRPELALLATIVALVGGTLWWYVSRIDESAWIVDTGVSETRHAAQADAASIAVLPFVDMSPGKDQEYFADGMSEELLNLLSQLPQLRVIARTSSFSFKGKEVDIAEIAHKLNVAHVLEGSVRKSGDTVRVTAQLIRASDSTHLWSQTYDRQLTDVFKVQDEIARAVVAALQVKLLPAQQVTNRRRTANSEAYDEYLLGNHFYNRGSHDGFHRAIAAYRRAVMLDPDFGGAYAALALAEFYDLDFVTTPAELETGRQRVLVAAEKALALAPDLAQAYSTRGILRATLSQDWTGAQLDVTRALAQGPGSVTVHRHYAVVAVALGRSREGIAAAARAVELDPVSPYAWNSLGLIYLLSGQYAQAREALNRALVLDPAFIFSNYNLACVELLEGRPAQALPLFRRVGGTPYGLAGVAMAEYSLGHARESRQALDELIERYANGAAYHVARAHAWRGEKEEAFRWLERAYLQHDRALYAIRPDPLLASLHKDARFAALLKTLGLPP